MLAVSIITTLAPALTVFIKYAGLVLISGFVALTAYFARDIPLTPIKIEEQTIDFKILEILGGSADRVTTFLAIFLGVTGILYGLFERHRRRDAVEHMEGRIRSLEKCLDPNRSSSGLTTRGDTRPEDDT